MKCILGQLDSLQVRRVYTREGAHGLELFCHRVPVEELRVRPSPATLERKLTHAELPIDPDKPEGPGNCPEDVGFIREGNGRHWAILPSGRRTPAGASLAVTLL